MAMNQSEVERMLRRHDHDISDLHTMLGEVQTTQVQHTGRFDQMDARFDGIDTRLDGMDGRFDGLDAKVDEILTILRSPA